MITLVILFLYILKNPINLIYTLMIMTIHFQNENFTFSEFFAIIQGNRHKKQGPSINNHEVLNH